MLTPMLVDADPGADDAVAIAFLAAEPSVNLVGVGTVHGNVPPAMGADNALRVLERAGRAGVPVAVGADRPLNGERPWLTGQLVHGYDGLGGHAGAAPSARQVAESAVEQLVRQAHAYPGELHLVCLAPLTNLALGLRLEPELPSLLGAVTWMGGAVDHPGNAGFRAEANSWHDPEAADAVLSAGLPLTVLPLDVTMNAWAGADWFAALAGIGSPIATALIAWTGHYVDGYTAASRGKRGCVLHDPVAAAIAVDPALVERRRHQVVVESHGYARGATWVDRRDPVLPGTELPQRHEVDLVVAADCGAALERVLSTIRRAAEVRPAVTR